MDFEAELMDLIDRAVADDVERDDIIAALELRLMALKEEQDDGASGLPGDDPADTFEDEPGLEGGDGSEARRAE